MDWRYWLGLRKKFHQYSLAFARLSMSKGRLAMEYSSRKIIRKCVTIQTLVAKRRTVVSLHTVKRYSIVPSTDVSNLHTVPLYWIHLDLCAGVCKIVCRLTYFASPEIIATRFYLLMLWISFVHVDSLIVEKRMAKYEMHVWSKFGYMCVDCWWRFARRVLT